MSKYSLHFETGPKGALSAAKRGDICIVVDVLRASASTSIIAALMGGIKNIRLGDNSSFDVPDGQITAGEQNCVKIPHFNYGNSPADLLDNKHVGQELLFFSTNGIPSIKACASYKVPILIGAIINTEAVGLVARKMAHHLNKNITIVLAGYKGTLEEDDLLAGSIIYYKELKDFQILGHNKPIHSDNVLESLWISPAGIRLSQLNLKDIHFCAQEDLTSIVPFYDPQKQDLVPIVHDSAEWEKLL